MKIILLGPPGAGKGTHAQKLVNDFNVPQISTGDILRKAIREETEVGKQAKTYIDQGQLVPDFVVIEIVRQRLNEGDCQNGYILDGFPRTIVQAEKLKEFAEIDAVINLVLSDEAIINRLSGRRVCSTCGGTYHVSLLNGKEHCEKCGEKLIQREDDKEETIKKRLNVYNVQTAPLIEHYKKINILHDVDCSGTIEQNHKAVLEALKK